jgi:hypothetical protein
MRYWILWFNYVFFLIDSFRSSAIVFLFVCICFIIAPKSRYGKLVDHKIVTWDTNRPRRLYFTIFFNLLFLYFPIFSLNCICCHLFSADNISVFTYNFIHIQFHVHSKMVTDFNGREDTLLFWSNLTKIIFQGKHFNYFIVVGGAMFFEAIHIMVYPTLYT